MSTFSYTPDFGSEKEVKPLVSKVQFGDGYQARQTHGINLKPRTYKLQFANRDVSEIDAIESFLEARVTGTGDYESFDWTPPREDTSAKFVCFEWTRNFKNSALDGLTATFEEVFEP